MSDDDIFDDAEILVAIDADDFEDINDIEDIDDFDSAQLSNAHMAKVSGEQINMHHVVTSEQAGVRIDKLSAEIFDQFSRGQLQDWLKSGALTVNGNATKPKYRVKVNDDMALNAVLESHSEDVPENIALDVVYEDEWVLVINKPVGMVVHPGAGNPSGTLVNALLYHYPDQAYLPRAGLVHRIDKDTSGLLIIGKTKMAQLELQSQLKDKSVYRHYRCVVAGDEASLMRQRTIDAPIGRHRSQRTKMAVTSTGKAAVTHIRSITPLADHYCLLDVELETGRTHQIRVHLSHIGHPIVGDGVYGSKRQLRAGMTEAQRQAVLQFSRQALHAYRLGFIHPHTQQPVTVTAPLPEDMQALITQLSDASESVVK
ncbi:RluA family pseudouridine synthase [Psychrobacter sp. I-STPA10]|uniref:RluA family pseudouridine synthase n=1 Tax=Psychrobacter sp. I-STPA10 TaxID=2585769 RepID=UPI003FA7D949